MMIFIITHLYLIWHCSVKLFQRKDLSQRYCQEQGWQMTHYLNRTVALIFYHHLKHSAKEKPLTEKSQKTIS